MTVVFSRPEVPGDRGDQRAITDASLDCAITASGVSVASVPDLAAGRGPEWLEQSLTRSVSDVVAWRRHIHANPELSNREYGTTELVESVLRSLGLRPTVLSCGTGVVCDIGSGDTCVALRADMDALPITEATGLPFASSVDGVAHACGHDAHTAILMATAMALTAAPELPVKVRLIFQPAEEVMHGGALDVISEGWLDGVDRIFALHCAPHLPVGTIGTRTGAVTSAADLVSLRLSSPGGHTARPHLTADLVHALGTVVTGLPGVLSRRVDPRSGTVLTWGSVHAGDAPNTVPEHGSLLGTLRTADREVWRELEPLVASAVEALVAPTGVELDFDYRRGVPPVVCDEDSTAQLRVGAAAALGSDALVDIEQSSGGEDFGWYLEHVPGAFARLGVWPGHGPVRDIHQGTFELDERALLVGARTLVHTVLAS
ncbi:amidohydrolase [Haloechinothrix sp. YIM 98757]|uniref:Amidohydrolase n=1 Tax=Haloechinothrix aidingensis TaxID=2752311 RepID=A0A838AFF8_9PSEU|nr:amidohydrolase [Haloechinothrix aidingensis]MBA0128066.1 amidohydrolase [Haloechinothrix aidingensis]